LGKHRLYAFLTCEANEVVKPIYAKAMPVLLTTEDEADQWLTAPIEEALELQRPLPSDQMTIVAKGEREDDSA
jgi:putative SOS response-associated peptidase YedK